MKKTLYALNMVWICFYAIPFFGQEADITNIKETEGSYWMDYNAGVGRINAPLFCGQNGDTYLVGQWSASQRGCYMHEIAKTPFSYGTSVWINYLDTKLQGKAYVPLRFMVGPALAVKTPITKKGYFYVTATAGLKWDVHWNRNLPEGYYFCQDALSLGGSLSASCVFFGNGVKFTVYSYGNSRKVNVKDPLIDGWDISYCVYLSQKKQ